MEDGNRRILTHPHSVVSYFGFRRTAQITGAAAEDVMVWGTAGRAHLIPHTHIPALRAALKGTAVKIGASAFAYPK